jgi:5'-nucleotidase
MRHLRPLVPALGLAALLALAAPASAGTVCEPGTTAGHVSFGAYDTGVGNRCLPDGRWLDDRFADEGPWGSEQDFFRHVVEVSSGLVSGGLLHGRDHARLVVAGKRSGVGRELVVKLIAFNDFHGNIKAFEGSWSNPGVARFATRIQALKAANPMHAVVSAGDMIGASPLTSALFKDEPTIEAMNRIGIDFNAVGNHEFDEGKDELLRMQHGGSHPSDPYTGLGMRQDLREGRFAGAAFGFLAANVVDTATGATLLPAYGVKDFLGHRVAFVGMTLEATPTIVSPSGVAGLTFADEAQTVNRLVPTLQDKGIRSVVVLVHEGGFAAGGINGCSGVSGPIVDIVARLDPEIDLVVTGHTHRAYNCLLPKRDGSLVRVTSAGQYARNLSDIDLTIDTRSSDVVAVAATNLVTGTTTAEDPALTELVAHYDALSIGPKSRVIGRITSTITRSANAAGESALGDVIADAQLDATDDAGTGQAVVAFMNPGGIRADLSFNAPAGDVTYGDAFTVQPFGNSLVTMTLTGAQIRSLLESQFAGCNGQTARRILQVSAGFTYAYTEGAACNGRVGNVMLNGRAVEPTTAYRVTVNSFLADGGDSFTVLREGTQRLGGAVDVDAFEAYLQANPSGVGPGAQDRIVKLD